MRTFHANWFYVTVVSTGLVGVWGLGMAVMKKTPGRAFGVARGLAIAAVLIQVGAGVILFNSGIVPGNAFHMFYGVVASITLAIVYVYRAQMARKPALSYGLLLLFVMGLGFRAWANVN
jgi:Co/Zn/Cd efflux system component